MTRIEMGIVGLVWYDIHHDFRLSSEIFDILDDVEYKGVISHRFAMVIRTTYIATITQHDTGYSC